MPGKKLHQIKIHLANHRGDAAVLQAMNVPARFRDGPLAPRDSSLRCQPAVFAEHAVDRVSVEPAFLRDEQVVGACILRSHLQPGPQGRDFIHARAPTHPKQRLRSLEGSLEALDCDLHVAPVDIGKLERDEFAGAERVQEADQQHGMITSGPAPSRLEDVEQLVFREVFEGIRLLCPGAFRADISHKRIIIQSSFDCKDLDLR